MDTVMISGPLGLDDDGPAPLTMGMGPSGQALLTLWGGAEGEAGVVVVDVPNRAIGERSSFIRPTSTVPLCTASGRRMAVAGPGSADPSGAAPGLIAVLDMSADPTSLVWSDTIYPGATGSNGGVWGDMSATADGQYFLVPGLGNAFILDEHGEKIHDFDLGGRLPAAGWPLLLLDRDRVLAMPLWDFFYGGRPGSYLYEYDVASGRVDSVGVAEFHLNGSALATEDGALISAVRAEDSQAGWLVYDANRRDVEFVTVTEDLWPARLLRVLE